MRLVSATFTMVSLMKGNHLILLILLGLMACKKDEETNMMDQISEGNKPYNLPVPAGFPYPEIPENNVPTLNRIELGAKLFADPILSRDSSISCQHCHQPHLFFQDQLPVSVGIEGRKVQRNSPSLINVAYQPSMFWDGGNTTLEMQVLAVFDNHAEFDLNINLAIERLQKHPTYPALFRKAYDQEPSVFALVRALASFERTLIGGNSPYDQFIQKGDSTAISASAKRGFDLFFSEKAECFHCHQSFLFTDFSFMNNGLYQAYADSGRARITQDPADVGRFKVPSLRNIEKTAPYMHDGSLKTLEEVIEHYNAGGKIHRNKSPFVLPLGLNQQEKDDLIAFLKSLTDSNPPK